VRRKLIVVGAFGLLPLLSACEGVVDDPKQELVEIMRDEYPVEVQGMSDSEIVAAGERRCREIREYQAVSAFARGESWMLAVINTAPLISFEHLGVNAAFTLCEDVRG
jgi:hypothetical protein